MQPPKDPLPGKRPPRDPADSSAGKQPSTQVTLDTLRAYEETHYRVLGSPPFTLRIGAPSAELAALHRRHAVDSSTFVTAYNPFSQTLTEADNNTRHERLLEDVAVKRRPHLDGIGEHPGNGWPGERSLLVLGADLKTARELGERWEQNAIVWAGSDAVPQLILLR